MQTPLVFDPETVKRIQRRCGMPARLVDGDFGKLTLAAVDETLASVEQFLAKQIGVSPIKAEAAKPRPLATSMAAAIVRNAEEEIGTKEQGGNNRGKRVQEYQAATWLEGTGWAWCAAFVCFVLRDAIAEFGAVPWKRPLTAGAYDFENWAKQNAAAGVQLFKPARKTKIKAGDIVVFNISHIGIAVKDQASDGSVETVEGNTGPEGGRDGDGVWRKNRHVSEFRAVIRVP
jgi:hypothetical protein